jgi:uncharacterized phage protein gp47/JayE
MPWTTPQLRDVRALVRDSIHSSLPGSDATVPNSVLRVLSDSQGALCHLTLQYIDWLSLQLLPDTAESEWLDRHGRIWLVNADGSRGRKLPTLAGGTATFTGVGGTLVPQFTQLSLLGVSTTSYETLDAITLDANFPTAAPVRALDPGTTGNLLDGATLGVVGAPAGVDNIATVVTMDGGTDIESDDDLRARVLFRIQQPPMGGDASDYVAWTLAVPGVTRAWCYPQEMGIGTVTVRFMCDELRADNDGFPEQVDVDAVTAYLDSVRPVTIKDFWALSPLREPITVAIQDLVPDTPAIRAEIEVSLDNMLLAVGSPGQTIYGAWKTAAIMNVPGVQSFRLANYADDIMPSPGHLAVLDTIIYSNTV